MFIRVFYPTIAIFMFFLTTGCGVSTVKLLDEFEYRNLSLEIEAYAGNVSRLHKTIAIITTSSMPDKSAESKKILLEELIKKAKELGADAVEDVRLLRIKKKGFIREYHTLFPSYHQGTEEPYVLRGNAIRFTD